MKEKDKKAREQELVVAILRASCEHEFEDVKILLETYFEEENDFNMFSSLLSLAAKRMVELNIIDNEPPI